MAYERPGAAAPDYLPCRYGTSRLTFRGPRARLDAPYVAALGGTETYGKFVADPWPALLERSAGRPVANLGCVNAGADVFLSDPGLIALAAGAAVRVVQVTGAMNLSNPYYTVHPRRNDRFIAATPALRALFPEVDFTEFHFTRHLLFTLARVSPIRFSRIAQALAATWEARMASLLHAIGGPTVLLWMADRPPPPRGRLDSVPPLVDRNMIDALRPMLADVIEIVCPASAPPPLAPMAAVGLPDAAAHVAVASRLQATLARLT